MTTKVTSVQANGTWTANDGTVFYKFNYELDGKTIAAMHKTAEPVGQAGDEVDYEITAENEYGLRGKVRKPSAAGGYRGGGGQSRAETQEQISRQWAINAAMTWHLGTAHDPTQDGLRQVAAIARLLLDMRDDMDGFIVKMKNQSIADATDLPF